MKQPRLLGSCSGSRKDRAGPAASCHALQLVRHLSFCGACRGRAWQLAAGPGRLPLQDPADVAAAIQRFCYRCVVAHPRRALVSVQDCAILAAPRGKEGFYVFSRAQLFALWTCVQTGHRRGGEGAEQSVLVRGFTGRSGLVCCQQPLPDRLDTGLGLTAHQAAVQKAPTAHPGRVARRPGNTPWARLGRPPCIFSNAGRSVKPSV